MRAQAAAAMFNTEPCTPEKPPSVPQYQASLSTPSTPPGTNKFDFKVGIRRSFDGTPVGGQPPIPKVLSSVAVLMWQLSKSFVAVTFSFVKKDASLQKMVFSEFLDSYKVIESLEFENWFLRP